MKQFFLLPAALLLTVSMSFAQQSPLQQFIDQHKQDGSFTYAFLSKDLFEVAIKTDIAEKDWQKLHNVVKNIGSLSILAADNVQNGLSLYREARAAVPAGDFDELLTVRDADDRVHIWAKSEEDLVTDLVLLVGTSDEFVLICFSGNLELGNIAELSRLFDAGTAEQLVRTTEAVAADFKITPNPNNGVFTLSLTDELDIPVSLSLIDQSGRQLAEQQIPGGTAQEVRLRDLPAGNYWLQVRTQKGKIGIKPMQVTF